MIGRWCCGICCRRTASGPPATARCDRSAPDQLLAGSRQLWVRRDATSPWLLDILLTPHAGNTWISVRDERIRRPVTEAVWSCHGLRYLRSEIVLHLKARHSRPKDHADVRATCPHLDAAARRWLYATLTRTKPGHPWLEEVAPSAGENKV